MPRAKEDREPFAEIKIESFATPTENTAIAHSPLTYRIF
jgi:hypothetical protein